MTTHRYIDDVAYGRVPHSDARDRAGRREQLGS